MNTYCLTFLCQPAILKLTSPWHNKSPHFQNVLNNSMSLFAAWGHLKKRQNLQWSLVVKTKTIWTLVFLIQIYASGFLQSALSCVAALWGIKPLSGHILLMECTKAQIILPIAFTTRLDGGRDKKQQHNASLLLPVSECVLCDNIEISSLEILSRYNFNCWLIPVVATSHRGVLARVCVCVYLYACIPFLTFALS